MLLPTPGFIPPPVPLVPAALNAIVPTGGLLAGAAAGAAAGAKAGAILGPKGALAGAVAGALLLPLLLPEPTAPGNLPGVLDPGLNDPEPTPEPETPVTPVGDYPVPDPPGKEGVGKIYAITYTRLWLSTNYRSCSDGYLIDAGQGWTSMGTLQVTQEAQSLSITVAQGSISYSCASGSDINTLVDTLVLKGIDIWGDSFEKVVVQDNYIQHFTDGNTYYESPQIRSVQIDAVEIDGEPQPNPTPVPKPPVKPRPLPIPLIPLRAPEPDADPGPFPPTPIDPPLPVPDAPPLTEPVPDPSITPAPGPAPNPLPVPGPDPDPEPATVPGPFPPTTPGPGPIVTPAAPEDPLPLDPELGVITPPDPPPIPTPPDTHFPTPGGPGVNPGGTRPDVTAVAAEVGRIEQKVARLGNPGGLGDLTDLVQLLLTLLSFFESPINGTNYQLQGVCESVGEGEEQPVAEFPVPEAYNFDAIVQRLDVMQDLFQQHLAYRTPTCNGQRKQGDIRTISFISDEVSPNGHDRVAKRLRYRSKSGTDLGGLIDHWSGFTWQAGPVIVEHADGWWGKVQVWASSIDEGKRVIRHAAGEAGIDPDQVGRWSVSGSNNPRYGSPGTMRVNKKGGYWWITARDGPSERPAVART